MTDYRELCAEILQILDQYEDCQRVDWDAWRDTARAALAQKHVSQPYKLPEPVGPTDEEIMELMPQQMRDDLANAARALAGFDRANVKAAGACRIILNRHAVDHARAVLARWGTPTNNTREGELMNRPITPPPELVEQWRKEPEYTDGKKLVTMVTMTTDRLMQLCEKSAQYGADQELEACAAQISQCCLLTNKQRSTIAEYLHFCRRTPPT
jgi:hypothetical protein